ncbi:MAG TPA: beta-ketoacyl-[acyl-carrier-protein] synthase II [Gammaproteobacteria bacterium]|nr:beta-ketoacyl-[acyl-carrier-protein] synthase II [Gammaproteobacteria bacterium]
MSQRRVVVTGLGIVSPVGLTVQEAWENIIAGRSGIRSITEFDVTDFPVRFGGTVKGFDVSDYMSKKDARRMERFIHYGFAAGTQAMKDAGLEVTEANAERIGVSIGSGIGGLRGIEKNYDAFLEGGPRKISPFFVPANIINMIGGNLSISYGLKGPNIAMVTACTSGTHSIGEAARIIAYGDADAMLAGGAEMATTHTGLGGFAAAKALSTRNDDPQAASRPWDLDRDGFVLGDGAGVMVLEEYEQARARGANIYAEVSGYGMSGDAYHMTQPAPNGDGAARCMRNAIRDAGLNPDQIDYINAHGTSTPAGDLAEVQGIKTALGDHAYRVAVSSTKSMTGHLLGAAGGVEAIFSILALRDQVAPPTINQVTADPECDLDFVPNEARNMTIRAVMSNSFGFGGTNGAIVFTRPG